MQDAGAKAAHADRVNANVEKAEAMGRWPANLCHDGSPEVVALFPQTGKSTGTRAGVPGFSGGFAHGDGEPVGYGDTGSAARFFYCAKASKRDRDEGLDGFEVKPCGSMEDDGYAWGREAERGRAPRDTKRANTHCTVKPTDLMRHLCRLVTPPGGVVLDPFMGSGSTGKAAMLEGFRFIGIEREAEYVAIAEARIKAAMASTPAAPAAPETMPLFDQSPEGATA
jgi:site-specific DNA-methyltransferase (adenine-specific)